MAPPETGGVHLTYQSDTLRRFDNEIFGLEPLDIEIVTSGSERGGSA